MQSGVFAPFAQHTSAKCRKWFANTCAKSFLKRRKPPRPASFFVPKSNIMSKTLGTHVTTRELKKPTSQKLSVANCKCKLNAHSVVAQTKVSRTDIPGKTDVGTMTRAAKARPATLSVVV